MPGDRELHARSGLKLLFQREIAKYVYQWLGNWLTTDCWTAIEWIRLCCHHYWKRAPSLLSRWLAENCMHTECLLPTSLCGGWELQFQREILKSIYERPGNWLTTGSRKRNVPLKARLKPTGSLVRWKLHTMNHSNTLLLDGWTGGVISMSNAGIGLWTPSKLTNDGCS